MGRKLFYSFWILLLFVVSGCGATAVTPEPTPTLHPQAVQGKVVFERECASCHSLLADTTIVGPSLVGIATQAETRVAGQDAQTYLLTSILRPNDHLVDGFSDLMPTNYGKRLSGEEVDATVAFLLTLE